LDLVKLFELKVRRYDTFCRFGGDEFLILLTDTTESGAREIANRLLAATAAAKILPDKESLTCSFGVYSLNSLESGPISPDTFLYRADQALFEAKRLGRNRIFVFSAVMASAIGEGWAKEIRTPVTRSKNRRPS
jgi:diguanylate cyclase (GGDEF)-like protein